MNVISVTLETQTFPSESPGLLMLAAGNKRTHTFAAFQVLINVRNCCNRGANVSVCVSGTSVGRIRRDREDDLQRVQSHRSCSGHGAGGASAPSICWSTASLLSDESLVEEQKLGQGGLSGPLGSQKDLLITFRLLRPRRSRIVGKDRVICAFSLRSRDGRKRLLL